MLPGFTGPTVSATTTDPVGASPPVRLAGIWDPPSQRTCVFAGTETFCTGTVLWCKETYSCRNAGEIFPHTESKTPYPCGVCIGVSDPSDW